MRKKLFFIFIAISAALIGGYSLVRAFSPRRIQADPGDSGYCAAFGIRFNPSSVERIYLHPDVLLADPEAFLSADEAYLLLSKMRVEQNEPLDILRWEAQVRKISAKTLADREKQFPYALSRQIVDGQETFCKVAVPHVLSYLPAGVETSTTVYLTALDPIHTGVAVRERIALGLSHPHYRFSEALLDQGSAAAYNILVHELFHRVYNDAWMQRVETPIENASLQTLMDLLQNEGMANYVASKAGGYYPPGLNSTYLLQNFKPSVRYGIDRINKVFQQADTKSADQLFGDVSRLHRRNVDYIVGAYMAGTIEEQLGRDVLKATVSSGPKAFIQTYNSVAEEGMQIQFFDPENEPVSIYRHLRTAALEGAYGLVSDDLDAIQADQTPPDDVEGYLLYNTGYILLQEDQLELAEAAFRLHITLLPEIASGYIGLGDVLVQRGNIVSATENYHRAMKLDPRNGWLTILIKELEEN